MIRPSCCRPIRAFGSFLALKKPIEYRNLPASKCTAFVSSVRQISGAPWDTNYYQMAGHDIDEILGEKRIESSKAEAIVRRIAQKLLLHDSTQRAMLEQEFADEKIQSLHEIIATRDEVPRSNSLGQTALSKKLRKILDQDHPQLLTEVAKVFWENQIRRTSTYKMVARRLLILGYPQAAKFIMESLLMGTQKEHLLDTSTYCLCLEIAMATNDRNQFLSLTTKFRQPEAKSPRLQKKFCIDDSNDMVTTLVAEGFMKFRLRDSLDQLIAKHRGELVYIKLLAVKLEDAYRSKDVERARSALDEFVPIMRPDTTLAARVLIIASKFPELSAEIAPLVESLSPQKYHLFYNKPRSYFHPYALY